MFVSILLWVVGGILILFGIIKTLIYINKNKEFKGYKMTRGCVVEHISKEGHIKFDDEEFGYDAINYDEDDQAFLIQDGINTHAGIVEFMVKDKKYRIRDSVNDTNLMPIGQEVMVKYNPKKPKDAFIVEDFDGMVFYTVGIFLLLVGTFLYF